MQGLLELLDLPYVGSGVLASALAMNKVMSKHLYANEGLPTPDYVVLRRGEDVDLAAIVERLGGKTVVKPANEGSSVGMTIVHEPAELPAAIDLAFACDPLVLVERFEAGVEVTVAVLGNRDAVALPTLEVVAQHEFYDYESKYVPGMSKHIIPARVSEEQRAECQRLAVAAHVALGCAGMSRSDTIVTPDGRVLLLETNTIPGMTKTSLLPDAARRRRDHLPGAVRAPGRSGVPGVDGLPGLGVVLARRGTVSPSTTQSGQRQLDDEGRASARSLLHADAPAVVLGDDAHDVEAESQARTRAAAVQTREALEDAVPFVRRGLPGRGRRRG